MSSNKVKEKNSNTTSEINKIMYTLIWPNALDVKNK
jgi:hypothetical protein